VSSRNPRRNPYPPLEDLPPARASVLARLWRWRTEILLLACTALVTITVIGAAAEGTWWPLALVTGTVVVPAVPARSRNWIIAHLWCVFTRHRLQRVFSEMPLHTRKGRLPLVLWITPTREGEKALIMCRAGVSADAFDAFTAEFEAACSANRVRVAKHAKRPQFVTIDVIRRTMNPGAAAPGLEALYGYNWIPLGYGPDQVRDPEEPPDIPETLVLSHTN
jgi:hypothetical protein